MYQKLVKHTLPSSGVLDKGAAAGHSVESCSVMLKIFFVFSSLTTCSHNVTGVSTCVIITVSL